MMETRRQKHRQALTERRERLTRIANSAPPASTIDGALRRWKDERAIEAGEDPHAIDDEDDDGADGDEGGEALDADGQPPRPVVAAQPAYKPGTRQAAPTPAKATNELPWWAKAKPGEMTAAAEQHRERMSGSKAAKWVSGKINNE